jgi:hypothetical protein
MLFRRGPSAMLRTGRHVEGQEHAKVTREWEQGMCNRGSRIANRWVGILSPQVPFGEREEVVLSIRPFGRTRCMTATGLLDRHASGTIWDEVMALWDMLWFDMEQRS